ncbi:MAG TPA: hypothetical protein VIH96_00980, partial [Paraburkholderia sp.]
IAPSNNKPLPCGELFAQMSQHPVAPPPGQKMHAPPKPALAGAAAADKGSKTNPAANPATPAAPSQHKPQEGQEPLYKGS